MDINGVYYGNSTPLECAINSGHLAMVKRILEHPGLRLGKRSKWGSTALHWACFRNNDWLVPMIQLICQDSRCGPGVVNKKDRSRFGCTALMRAVMEGNLDILKELDMEGTDFSTKYKYDGTTLIEMAREKNNAEVLEYLIERNNADSLQVIAAQNVVRYMGIKADFEALEFPETVRQILAGGKWRIRQT